MCQRGTIFRFVREMGMHIEITAACKVQGRWLELLTYRNSFWALLGDCGTLCQNMITDLVGRRAQFVASMIACREKHAKIRTLDLAV